MDVSGAIRTALFQAISGISVDGVAIPVFDGIVNPNVTIPTIRNANVYIVLQDQQESEAPNQNMCSERIMANITVRVVTKYATGGVVDRTLCDTIAGLVHAAVRTGRKDNLTSSAVNIQNVDYPVSRNIDEFAGGQTALSRVIIYSITANI